MTPTIGAVTKTVCDLMGVSAPRADIEPALAPVLTHARVMGIDRCERVLLYAPDAIGLQLCRALPDIIAPVAQTAAIGVEVKSVVPPVTPVCFSTMFTGLLPASHGIRRYEKPVLHCDTLFDRLLRAGKRVAIVTVRDSSIDRLFRERAIDYVSEPYDPEVTEATVRLIEHNRHDFVLAYHQEYDDALHRTTPRSTEAIDAFRRHVRSFVRLVQAAAAAWHTHDRLVGFVPDHGAHVDPATGTGTHGLDIPEDMDVLHFYGLARGLKPTTAPEER